MEGGEGGRRSRSDGKERSWRRYFGEILSFSKKPQKFQDFLGKIILSKKWTEHHRDVLSAGVREGRLQSTEKFPWRSRLKQRQQRGLTGSQEEENFQPRSQSSLETGSQEEF